MIRDQRPFRHGDRRKDKDGIWEWFVATGGHGMWVLIEASEEHLARVRRMFFGRYIEWTVGRA